MAVRLTHGVESIENSSLVGMTVSSVLADPAFTDLLGLEGNESASVSSGSGHFVTQTGSYVFRDGDVVRFERQSGEKGIA